jgi:hypothetical protein
VSVNRRRHRGCFCYYYYYYYYYYHHQFDGIPDLVHTGLFKNTRTYFSIIARGAQNELTDGKVTTNPKSNNTDLKNGITELQRVFLQFIPTKLSGALHN